MKIVGPLIAALVARGAAKSRGHDEHPIVGVIDLLKGLKDKVIEEGQGEEVTYAKFSTWCADSERTLKKSVEKSKEAIDTLESEVEAKTAENKTLTDQIDKLTEEIAEAQKGETEAKKARDDANALYTTADKDYADTIKAFEDAIKELETAKTSSSSAALVQALLQKLPVAAAGRLTDRQLALLQNASSSENRPDMLSKGDYGKHTKKYSFKSDNVIELLKELKMSFEDQRVQATKEETNSANAYALAKDARDNAIQAATTAKTEKTTALGDVQTALTEAKGSLKDAEDDLEADSNTLKSTKKQCDMKASEWEERVAIRAGEVKAIEEGIKILAKVSGVRTEAPTNPVPPAAPAEDTADGGANAGAFLELRSNPSNRAITLLKKEASRLHSKSFMRFAQQLENKVAGSPFDDVNNMIQKMIFRLMAEQKDEDDHKNWCDLELNKTNNSITDKEDKLTELGLKISAAKTSVVELTGEIQSANEMVAKIEGFIEEATEVRNIGKKENAAAVKDAQDAQKAIAKATAVIEEHYKDQGVAFVQRAPVTLPENPATWDSAYTSVSDPKAQPDGIISVLTTIASDFSRMEAETKAQESTDEKNYQEELSKQEIEKARRSKEADMKGHEKERLSEKIVSWEKSEKNTKDTKESLEQYQKDLQPACVEGDSTYDERKQARTDEIDALKEAQVILADAFNDNSTNATSSSFVQHKAFLAPVSRV